MSSKPLLALCAAATSGDARFFLGTDSAPHVDAAKETACGCAGCFTATNTLSILAEVFEQEGALDRLAGHVVHLERRVPDTVPALRRTRARSRASTSASSRTSWVRKPSCTVRPTLRFPACSGTSPLTARSSMPPTTVSAHTGMPVRSGAAGARQSISSGS